MSLWLTHFVAVVTADPEQSMLVVMLAVYAFQHIVAATGWTTGESLSRGVQVVLNVICANYGYAANAKAKADRIEAVITPVLNAKDEPNA